MEYKRHLPERKKNRLENFDYSSCGVYFITICTANRRNYFWESGTTVVGATIGRPPNYGLSTNGHIVAEAINEITSKYPTISIENYVIMPNHVHILLRICADESGRPMVAPTVSRVVQQFKGLVSKRIGTAIWQKSFHDHLIRNLKDFADHMRYIDENPVRWKYDELYREE